MENNSVIGTNFRVQGLGVLPPVENQQTSGIHHACINFHLRYQEAADCFRRADRDLGETAAFVAAFLTTVTAIEAVITVANDELDLSLGILQDIFYIYIGLFAFVLVVGLLRGWNSMNKRAQAEHEMDRAKKGILLNCPAEKLPRPEKE